MTDKTTEALKLAEEACKPAPDGRIPKTVFTLDDISKAAEMGRQAGMIDALAEPVKQEPVAVVEITYGREPECYVTGNIDNFPEGVFKLYAAPVSAKRECVDLTESDVEKIKGFYSQASFETIVRAVISAFKEKNK